MPPSSLNETLFFLRYKTLTVVTVMITAFCNAMLHSLVRGYPLYKCWRTHIEVHFHGVLWADITEVLTALLLATQVSWNVMMCHRVSSSRVLMVCSDFMFMVKQLYWTAWVLTQRHSVTSQKTCIFYPTSWYSFLNHAPIIILLITLPPPVILSSLSYSKMLL